MYSEDQVEQLVLEFYSTQNENRRNQLHEAILDIQTGVHAWQCGTTFLSSGNRQPSVQLFAANCLYESLTKRWSDLAELDGGFDQMRHFLQDRLVNGTFSTAVHAKLYSCLAVAMLQSVPDLWENPVGDMIASWRQSHPKLLLNTLGVFPSEQRRLGSVVQRRNLTRLYLLKQCAPTAGVVLEVGGTSPADAISCVEQWTDFPGVDLQDWTQVILQCLSFVQDEAYHDSVGAFFEKLARNEGVSRLEKLLEKMFEFCAHYLVPLIGSALSGEEDESQRTLLTALLALAETQTTYIMCQVTAQHPNQSAVESIRVIIDFLLKISCDLRQYPTEECHSDLAGNFWYSLQEDALIISCNRTEAQTKLCQQFVQPVYRLLLTGTIPKLKYPSADLLTSWTADDLETLDAYRTVTSDTITNCFRVLDNEALNVLLQFLANAESAQSIDGIEAGLFSFEACAEFVSCDCEAVSALLTQVLPRYNTALRESKRALNTKLRLIDKLSHVITTSSDHVTLFMAAVALIEPHLNDSDTVLYATLALKHLLGSEELNSSLPLQPLLTTLFTCFQNSTFASTDRLRALHCLGLVLGIQDRISVLENVKSLFQPILNGKNIFEAISLVVNNANTQQELMFVLDAIAELVATLGINDSSEDTWPVKESAVGYLLDQCMPTSVEHLNVIEKCSFEIQTCMCKIVHKGIGSLLERSEPFLSPICQLLSRIYPPNTHVFAVARQLFLIFGKSTDEKKSMLMELLTKWTLDTLQAYCTSEYTDILECMMGFAQQVSKKNFAIFDIHQIPSALENLLRMAVKILQTVQESPTVKQTALFLSETLKHLENPKMQHIVAEIGPLLVSVSFARMQREILLSSVEYLADVLFVLAGNFPQELRRCLDSDSQQHPLVIAMLKEVKNKRKFREFAKQINMEFRRSEISAS